MPLHFDPNLDIFAAEVDAIVNPTNCVGVMGAGLAREMKAKYPEMFAAYLSEYRAGKLKIGKVLPFRREAGASPRYIINLHTKYHWRDKGDLGGIAAGVKDLATVIDSRAITSIAIPMLGCGLGGLHWPDVRAVLIHNLRPVVERCEITLIGEGGG